MAENSFLPFLPGYSFTDPTKNRFGLRQTLEHRKGCPIAKTIVPTSTETALELLDAENKLWDNTLVELTYGPKKPNFQTLMEPETVAFDKKVLRFYAYLRETVSDWPSETFRIRPMIAYYYLEDDTMEIMEPRVRNCGIPQGVFIKRHRYPRPDGNGPWLWRDLNVAMDFHIYGKKFRFVNCDAWTKEFYVSSGIKMNTPEGIPLDPYTETRKKAAITAEIISPHIEDEKRWKFMNLDRNVLRFYGIWDDTLNIPSEMRKVIIQYYLSDDTMELLEVHHPNDGRDPYPILVRRQKIPIDRNKLPPTFPVSVLEITSEEIQHWFKAEDLGIGKTIFIFNRKILLYDCDGFTKRYYRTNFGVEDFTPIKVDPKPTPKVPLCVPAHSGIGTWEDSLQSCFSLRPEPPKKDVVKWLNFDDVFLRYSAYMDKFDVVRPQVKDALKKSLSDSMISVPENTKRYHHILLMTSTDKARIGFIYSLQDTVWPIDRSRCFIITFYPGDDSISIFEPFLENSGIPSGSFMKRRRLLKDIGPGDKPQYYEAKDFYIGSSIHASGRKFVLTDADRYVLTFMEKNKQLYSESAIEAHRNKLVETKVNTQPYRNERDNLLAEMRSEVIKYCGEGETPLPNTLDLGNGLHPKDEVKEKLYSANLPLSNDILGRAMSLCTFHNGKIDVDELNKLLLASFGDIK